MELEPFNSSKFLNFRLTTVPTSLSAVRGLAAAAQRRRARVLHQSADKVGCSPFRSRAAPTLTAHHPPALGCAPPGTLPERCGAREGGMVRATNTVTATEDELADLQRRFHLLEGDRKAFYEASQWTIKQNKETLELVKEVRQPGRPFS